MSTTKRTYLGSGVIKSLELTHTYEEKIINSDYIIYVCILINTVWSATSINLKNDKTLCININSVSKIYIYTLLMDMFTWLWVCVCVCGVHGCTYHCV